MHSLLARIGLLFAVALQSVSVAAEAPSDSATHHVAVSLVPESRMPAAGSEVTIAIDMRPAKGWHGYWENPGDAGLPLKIDWRLPQGASAGAPVYPVPSTLVISGMMNHVYEYPYALLLPLRIPVGAGPGTRLPISAKLQYLACTNAICVPENSEVEIELTVGAGAADPSNVTRFDAWRRAMPRPLGSPVHFEATAGKIRLGVPLPQSIAINKPHFFAATEGVVSYAAEQSFSREGDMLIIETAAGDVRPAAISGVLALGEGTGLSFTATAGAVPAAGLSLENATNTAGSESTLSSKVNWK
jgi:DsbC/DsbD-like thiol-disulfide interchange protein